MTGAPAFTVLIVLVALERVAELIVSQRNLRWSWERGGHEYGQGHYPVMVVLHLGLLVGALVEVHIAGRQMIPALAVPMLVLVLVLVLRRCGGGASLAGATVEHPGGDRPRPAAGDLRSQRLAVAPQLCGGRGRGVALPLVGSAWVTALDFSTLNAALLAVRIRTEDAALSLLPAAAS